MKLFFCGVGVLGGIGLCCLDFIESFNGCAQMMQGNSLIRWMLALCMASVALTVNALASQLVKMLIVQKEHSLSVLTIWLIFVVCITFDIGSTWVGLMCEFTGAESIGLATESASTAQYIAATVTSMFVTLGPFITTIFHELLKVYGGFAAIFSFLFGKES